MRKIFIVNGAHAFAHSGAKFNETVVSWDKTFFTAANGFEVQVTDVSQPYDAQAEVKKFAWADTIVYHTPIWWFSLPHKFKTYLDEVFTAGHRNGLYYNDGRKAENPEINYGTGGLMHGRNYVLTTSWNAPQTAFTLKGEFFEQKSVDEGVMFGFHKMNQFTGMDALPSFHFHDVEKNNSSERIEAYRNEYLEHLASVFEPVSVSEFAK
ncbi:MAG: flavodoxin family protein [Flavobacterium sp.]|uniref:NAD(P)H-dependent oxidoreductase n=1 Tax=Flavobacterium sp. TaxID=239 RepID=UPI001221E6DE|nr:NAD(P)H-dependent oxidoreductase [Flavobacterium sp.]RZJ68769.1 MAG: flavodoxin family protein [Flavobacterium sp.]